MGLCFTRAATYDIPITEGPSKPPAAPPPLPSSFGKPNSRLTSQIGSIFGKPMVDITSLFILDKELGRGQFGITYLCTEWSTGQKYACKSVAKRKLVSKRDIEDMRREVMILQHLSGQPNVVEFQVLL
jgi:calcium-dependent protein kinase